MLSEKVDKNIYNPDIYQEKFDKSSKDELSFFDELQRKIKHQIQTNRQITFNNLKETKESLSEIREKAKKLTDSIIQHDDTMIIEKQKIIDQALKKIHQQLFEVYKNEMHQIDDRVFSIEHLHNRLVDSNLEYLETYRHFLSGMIEKTDTHHHFLKQKSESINYTIDKHFQDIFNEFSLINKKITDIDKQITQLIEIKSHKEDILDEFFDIEIRHLTQEQINFNINEDPYSDSIEELTKKKEAEFKQFESHLHYQEDRLLDVFKSEIEDLYDAFYHEEYQKTYKQSQAEKYAKKMIHPIINEKKHVLLQYKKDNLQSINELKKGLVLYQKLYKTDPFLAQLFFDDGSREISDEVDFARLYKMNKSLKYHIYYTYKLAQLNHEMKINEYQFVHFIENKFMSQEIDFVNILKDIQSFLIENQSSVDASKIALKRDKHFIIYLSELIDAKIEHQIEKENLNRRYLSEFTRLFSHAIYQKADVDIELLNQSSSIRLALKESEIDTIHFKHLYQNEKRMLLIQQKRIESETEVNYQLITSTYLNQMRFAKEQIRLAEEEFKLRCSIMAHSIDSEKIHYYEMINHEVKLKDEAAMSHFSNYQKQVYEFIAEFESTESKKRRKQIEKSLSQVRESYKKEIDAILLAYRNNKKIQLYQKRLDELDMYLEDAYLAASKIHDKTIEEMDETYQLAEEKYNEFVSSIDRNNYPLDDFLYEALQDSKKRLEEKMLYASMTLDDKVGKAIETYKALYFKLNLKFDSKPVTKTLDEYLNQLQAIDQTFDQTNEEITNQYQIKVETYNTDIRQIQNHYQQLMNENTKEKNLEIQQKTTLINDKDAVFNDYIKQVKRQHQIELNQLVESYLNDVQTNKQMNQEVSDDYQSLIDAYKPYIQYSKKSKTIKRLIRQTLHAQKKAHRRDLKSLKKDIKRLTLK
jgi:hypothetical protein